jgi:hypothetical protein
VITIDRERTAARRFEDDRSKILKDGREILFREDWWARKAELWKRCGGRCEAWLEIIGVPPKRCTAEAIDPHHQEKRSIKRDDRLQNLKALCSFHHRLMHPEKQVRWTKRQGEAA